MKDAKATIDDILVARERLRAQLDGRYGEDALQAAMVRAIATKARPSKTHAEAWLRLVTHHEAARVKLYIRRHWVLREADLHCVPGIDEKRTLAALVAPEPQPETFRVAGEALSAEELMPILEAVLATLPQRDRDFLLGYEQSARSPRTGRRANADRVRAHRLRARVRAAVTSRVEQPLLHA